MVPKRRLKKENTRSTRRLSAIHILPRAHLSRDRHCSQGVAQHRTTRNDFACSFGTFSPLLTSSGPSVSTRAAAHYSAVTLTSSSPPVSTSRVCATATRILTLTSLTQFCASRYGAAAHHEVCDYVSVLGAASHYAAIDIDERDAVLRTTIRRDRASRAACDFEERDAFCASDGTRHIAEHGAIWQHAIDT